MLDLDDELEITREITYDNKELSDYYRYLKNQLDLSVLTSLSEKDYFALEEELYCLEERFTMLYEGEDFYMKACDYIVNELNIDKVIDIGACYGFQSEIFLQNNVNYIGVEQCKNNYWKTDNQIYVNNTYPCNLPKDYCKGRVAVSNLCVGYFKDVSNEDTYKTLSNQFEYVILNNLNHKDIIDKYFDIVYEDYVSPYTKEYQRTHPDDNTKTLAMVVLKRKNRWR